MPLSEAELLTCFYSLDFFPWKKLFSNVVNKDFYFLFFSPPAVWFASWLLTSLLIFLVLLVTSGEWIPSKVMSACLWLEEEVVFCAHVDWLQL